MAGFFNPHNALIPIALFEDVFNIFTELRVIPKEASNKVVGQELIKVNHLDKIDIKIQSRFKLVRAIRTTRSLIQLRSAHGILHNAHAELIDYLLTFILTDECLKLFYEFDFRFWERPLVLARIYEIFFKIFCLILVKSFNRTI